jgi:predicted esterase
LMSRRAKDSGVAFEPPYIPKTFLGFVEHNDPAHAPYTASDLSNPFFGKKVLVLSGADDRVVPWESSDEFVKKLNVGPNGVKKEIVYPGVGHKFTTEMMQETAQFLWDHLYSDVA